MGGFAAVSIALRRASEASQLQSTLCDSVTQKLRVWAPQAKAGERGMGIYSWLGGAKHKAERECTEAKRRGDSAKPNPKGAQASAWSPLCEPSELNSKTGMETNRNGQAARSARRDGGTPPLHRWTDITGSPVANARILKSSGCCQFILQYWHRRDNHLRCFQLHKAESRRSTSRLYVRKARP